MSEEEVLFDGFILASEVDREIATSVAHAIVAMVRLQWSTEHNVQEEYNRQFKELRNKILAIESDASDSLARIRIAYEKEQESRLAAEETARKATAHLENFSKRLDEIQQQEASRHREHNPALPEVRARVLAMTDGRCAYCNSVISPGKSDGNPEFVVEHVVPKSAGGPDHIANFVPACAPCNSQKSAAHVVEFIRKKVGGLNV